MTRNIALALLVALLLASVAVPQGTTPVSTDGRVKLLEADVALLQETVKKQQELLKDSLARLDTLKAEGLQLVKAVEKAERDGFAYPAPNINARQGLLDGLKRFGEAVSKQGQKSDD